MSKPKLNINLVKIREEINNLNELIWTKDPKRIYNMETTGFEDHFNLMQIEMTEKTKNIPTMNFPIKALNFKYPVLREDARVIIKRDNNLMIRAGGYNLEKTYKDLSQYAITGLI